MRFSMLYSGEQILSFKPCLVFYAGDSLKKQKPKRRGRTDNVKRVYPHIICWGYKNISINKQGLGDILETQFKWKHMPIIFLQNFGAEPDYFFFTNFSGKIIFQVPFGANLFFSCLSKARIFFPKNIHPPTTTPITMPIMDTDRKGNGNAYRTCTAMQRRAKNPKYFDSWKCLRFWCIKDKTALFRF